MPFLRTYRDQFRKIFVFFSNSLHRDYTETNASNTLTSKSNDILNVVKNPILTFVILTFRSFDDKQQFFHLRFLFRSKYALSTKIVMFFVSFILFFTINRQNIATSQNRLSKSVDSKIIPKSIHQQTPILRPSFQNQSPITNLWCRLSNNSSLQFLSASLNQSIHSTEKFQIRQTQYRFLGIEIETKTSHSFFAFHSTSNWNRSLYTNPKRTKSFLRSLHFFPISFPSMNKHTSSIYNHLTLKLSISISWPSAIVIDFKFSSVSEFKTP